MKKTLGIMMAVMAASIFIGSFIPVHYATAGEIGRDGRFIAYDNGTVLDTKTMLMWAAKDSGIDINWSKAKYYCENYRVGGYTDWRMPTLDELAELYDPSLRGYAQHCGSQYGRVKITNLINLTCCCPWSSETIGPDAAYFSFNHGLRYWYPMSYVKLGRALPVRAAEKKQAIEIAEEIFEKGRATIDVEFDTNKAVIKPAYRDEIKKFADVMNMHPELNVVIEGHTDSVGNAAYNQKLSERRAHSVRDYMIKEFGIAESRLTAKGFGMSRPIDNNETKAGAQKNRRVEATVDYTNKK